MELVESRNGVSERRLSALRWDMAAHGQRQHSTNHFDIIFTGTSLLM